MHSGLCPFIIYSFALKHGNKTVKQWIGGNSMESAIEPALDSFAGNIEIAIYIASEIEYALTEIYRKTDKRAGNRVETQHSTQQYR